MERDQMDDCEVMHLDPAQYDWWQGLTWHDARDERGKKEAPITCLLALREDRKSCTQIAKDLDDARIKIEELDDEIWKLRGLLKQVVDAGNATQRDFWIKQAKEHLGAAEEGEE